MTGHPLFFRKKIVTLAILVSIYLHLYRKQDLGSLLSLAGLLLVPEVFVLPPCCS